MLLHAEIKHCRARSHDLSIGLERGGESDVEIVVAEIGAYFSASTEGRIQSPIGQVTGNREIVIINGAIGRADGDNLSIRLNQDRKDIIFMTEKIGRNRAAVAKCRVEASIWVIPGQGKIGIGHIARIEIEEISPGGDDFSVRLQGQRECETTVTGKNRSHDPTGTKRSVQRPVGIVTRDLEIAGKSKERISATSDDDFPVGLNYHGGD